MPKRCVCHRKKGSNTSYNISPKQGLILELGIHNRSSSNTGRGTEIAEVQCVGCREAKAKTVGEVLPAGCSLRDIRLAHCPTAMSLHGSQSLRRLLTITGLCTLVLLLASKGGGNSHSPETAPAFGPAVPMQCSRTSEDRQPPLPTPWKPVAVQ